MSTNTLLILAGAAALLWYGNKQGWFSGAAPVGSTGPAPAPVPVSDTHATTNDVINQAIKSGSTVLSEVIHGIFG